MDHCCPSHHTWWHTPSVKDKELLWNNLQFLQYSEVLHKMREYCVPRPSHHFYALHETQTVSVLCICCIFLFSLAELKSYILEKLNCFMRTHGLEYRSGQGTASFSELGVRPRTATSNNGPRLWRCLRSKEEFNWTTAFFGFYKRTFWKDNSQCSTSQIWTVWESGQMA